jgi:hypothetical protein
MHGAPFREIARQHAPLAAALQQIKNGTEHLIQIHCPRAGFLAGIFQQRSDRFKLFATDVAGVHFSHAPHYLSFSEDIEQALILQL